MKKILIILWISFICFYSYGQINVGGKPYSFKSQIKAKSITKNENPKIELSKLDFDELLAEDRVDESIGNPFRYGKAFKVAYDWNNSGEWIELENGDRIWKLTISCPSAKSINLGYDKFWLPDGSLLYLYDKNKTTYIGGFNRRNNRGTKENPSGYATGLIFSDEITLEYYEPKEVRGEGIISISDIVYGYKGLNTLDEELCAVDINCSPEGDNWQDEKTSVALIQSLGGGACTGALIKNARGDGISYFLTANHCIDDAYDAVLNPDASGAIFWWNYEKQSCNGSTLPYLVTSGATVIANDTLSDFALLRLDESPYDLIPQYQAYYSGWDRQNPVGTSVCIHHPIISSKKISTAILNPPRDYYYKSWKVTWNQTTNGNSRLYDGSSGAPLYNNQSRIIGQGWRILDHFCEGQDAVFGKFSVSWNDGSEARRRLRDWLDPNNSNTNYLNGTYCTSTEYITNTTFSIDTIINRCSIYMQTVTVSNNANVAFHSLNNSINSQNMTISNGSNVSFISVNNPIYLQNVTINNGANAICSTANNLVINGEFVVELGSTFGAY